MSPPLLRRHARPLANAALIGAALAAAGCSEDIQLGRECLKKSGLCGSAVPGAREPVDASTASEAGALDSGARDAGFQPLLDAGSDAPSALPADAAADVGRFPALQNLSFELTNGTYGEVTTVSAALGGTVIAPWYTCQPIGVGTLTAIRSVYLVTPTLADGGTGEPFEPRDELAQVHVSPLLNQFFPLSQTLGEPLVAGQRYAFTLDIRAVTEGPRLTVEVLGGGANPNGCMDAERLAVSDVASVHEWKTVCFDFVPKSSHPRLFLQVKSSLGGIANESLVFDNVRVATPDSCRPPAVPPPQVNAR